MGILLSIWAFCKTPLGKNVVIAGMILVLLGGVFLAGAHWEKTRMLSKANSQVVKSLSNYVKKREAIAKKYHDLNPSGECVLSGCLPESLKTQDHCKPCLEAK